MKIQLPDFVIADLYKNSLVNLNDITSLTHQVFTNETDAPATKNDPWYMGSNYRHITVLVSEATQSFTDEESLQLLTNLFTALHFTLEDVAIVNHHHTPKSFAELQQQLQPQVCLLFGITTKDVQLPFLIPVYQVQHYNNCTFLPAASLNSMKGDSKNAKMEKTKLWMSLQQIFIK